VKILIIGDANHQFIRNLVKWLKNANNKLEIDIFNVNIFFNENYKKTYDNLFHAHDILFKKYIRHIPLLRRYHFRYMFKRKFKSINKNYDYIHIHYVSETNYFIKELIKQKGNKLILPFWGSDFYRANNKTREHLKELVLMADKVTFTNRQMMNELVSFYHFNNTDKYQIVRFDSNHLKH
jgi:glycosyltransferase involved in cell wall biosynthesis